MLPFDNNTDRTPNRFGPSGAIRHIGGCGGEAVSGISGGRWERRRWAGWTESCDRQCNVRELGHTRNYLLVPTRTRTKATGNSCIRYDRFETSVRFFEQHFFDAHPTGSDFEGMSGLQPLGSSNTPHCRFRSRRDHFYLIDNSKFRCQVEKSPDIFYIIFLCLFEYF